ncbi:MAG: hypothetical protein ACLUR5_12520 [Eubacterium ventriosum]
MLHKYQVYRKVGKNSKFVNIATTTSLKYTDKKVKTGKKYYYKVVAVNQRRAKLLIQRQ